MRKLLLLAGLCAAPLLTASAQSVTVRSWAPPFGKTAPFPDTTGITGAARTMLLKSVAGNHGIAVDGAGKIWIQPNSAANGDSVFVPALGIKRISAALYVYNPDGTPASFSPLLIAQFPDGSRDTLGGFTNRNSTGAPVWEAKTGRGLATDANGNIIATFFNTVYRINHLTGAGMNRALGTVVGATEARGLSGPAVSGNGSVFITGVFPGDPIAMLNPDFTFKENVTAADPGFQRAMHASLRGDTLYAPYYDKGYVLRFVRPDEFSGFSKPDTLLRGYKPESIATQPSTGWLWVSAGSPNDKNAVPNINDNVWYAFSARTLTNELGDVTASPQVPLDSIRWSRAASQGRPRAIAFSSDGNTVYVGQFSNIGEPISVHRYVLTVQVSNEDTRWIPADLDVQTVAPNPMRGAVRVRYNLHATADVQMRLFDLLGRAVMTVDAGMKAQGANEASFDVSGLAAGAYLLRLEVDGYTLSRRVTVAH